MSFIDLLESSLQTFQDGEYGFGRDQLKKLDFAFRQRAGGPKLAWIECKAVLPITVPLNVDTTKDMRLAEQNERLLEEKLAGLEDSDAQRLREAVAEVNSYLTPPQKELLNLAIYLIPEEQEHALNVVSEVSTELSQRIVPEQREPTWREALSVWIGRLMGSSPDIGRVLMSNQQSYFCWEATNRLATAYANSIEQEARALNRDKTAGVAAQLDGLVGFYSQLGNRASQVAQRLNGVVEGQVSAASRLGIQLERLDLEPLLEYMLAK